MPGSPPMSSAEPGTMPPPVTRSSSVRPVEKRGASPVRPLRPSKAMTRPLPPLRASPEPGGATTSASSISVFHSSHEGHLPAQRGETAPQFWHTKVDLLSFAMPDQFASSR